MACMILRIDPSIPRVWRSPHTIQFGIDHPLAVVDSISTGHERILDALSVGAPLDGLRAIASHHGLTHRDLDDLTRALAGVLVASAADDTTTTPPPFRVSLTGSTPTAHELARLLTAEGVTVTRHTELTALRSARTDLAIAVGHYVLHPELHASWLRRDIPHLPVVWGDAGVRIGPLIEPGHGPCLHCLERHHTDADPQWPVIASQLLDRTSALENPLRAADAAVIASRLALERLRGKPGRAVATSVDADGARHDEESPERHPECGCHGLADVIDMPVDRPRERAQPRTATTGRARRGSAMARAHRAATTATTRGGGAGAPA